ncbi:hypothetical protein [Helicobacter sp. 23-1045]
MPRLDCVKSRNDGKNALDSAKLSHKSQNLREFFAQHSHDNFAESNGLPRLDCVKSRNDGKNALDSAKLRHKSQNLPQ